MERILYTVEYIMNILSVDKKLINDENTKLCWTTMNNLMLTYISYIY